MSDMPEIFNCNVSECFYNQSNQCHAPAITIGADEPCCDTFLASQDHIHRQEKGMVGACHVSACQYNKEMLCGASGINVSPISSSAMCSTFSKK